MHSLFAAILLLLFSIYSYAGGDSSTMHHIRRYETSEILVMEDNMQIPVSGNLWADFMIAFNKISITAGIKPKESDQ
ncbi:MAG: hypothetical protein H0X33_12285 [Taibaiella sp.]|nr:hypothetical protein [Taibaiella sp.]